MKLKPCPFCGGRGIPYRNIGKSGVVCYCGGCFELDTDPMLSTGQMNRVAVQKWNRRTVEVKGKK